MSRKAVFLDRDGVINEVLSERVKFVNSPEQLHFLPGVPEAIRKLNESELFELIAVVTNQGGVGLGYLKQEELDKIHEHMVSELQKEDAIIHEVACCTHKPKEGCACRKPGSLMLEELAEKYNIDLSSSYMVGDREPDIQAGQNAGTKLVFIGEHLEDVDAIYPNLAEAAEWIIEDATAKA